MKKLLLISFILTIVYRAPGQKVALDFDGQNDVVTVPNASGQITASAMSMTFWVYPTNSAPSYPNYDGFAGFRNNSTADFYILQLSATTVEARFRNSGGTNYDITGSGLSVNSWQHYALTYNGSTLTLYRNGTVVGSTSASGSFGSSSETLFLGNLVWTSTNFYLDGKLDDITLWNKSLSAGEVSCIYEYGVDTSQAGLKLYYSCDENKPGGNNSGKTTLHDDMGNINGSLGGFSLSGSSSNWVTGAPSHTYINGDICMGDSMMFGTKYVNQEGKYYDYYQVASGCDSVVQLTLAVHEADTIIKNHRICMGDSIPFNGQYLKNEGTYTVTFTSRFGCDSTSIKNIDVDTVEVGISKGGNVLYSMAKNGLYQWYNCDGDSIIPGATGQTYPFTQHASYAVIVIQNGCKDTSECLYTALGVEGYPSPQSFIQPNPARNEIQITGLQSSAWLYVFDMTMRQVLGVNLNSHQKVDISALKNGTYIVYLVEEKETKIQKLIVD